MRDRVKYRNPILDSFIEHQRKTVQKHGGATCYEGKQLKYFEDISQVPGETYHFKIYFFIKRALTQDWVGKKLCMPFALIII